MGSHAVLLLKKYFLFPLLVIQNDYEEGNEDLIIVHDALDYWDCRLSLADLAQMPQWTERK
ncbi:ATP phosphoribosyltransferase 1 chloroplastic-like [Prunus yedoensis var. nudiflora]|uniref:ATP phosphoribosyltransferase 1 chloroplastic-like n=1 Tax=Prunus yedoensis var. nudiflora TaxID=2094558 RepID=A0A314Z928_PRUYE|nr:ATP phosphoribosyltransferase 1 chloroplastic-like [Prunus yedoensis var. nudiflora]